MKKEAHFINGSYHDQDLIREFLSYDVLFPELSVLYPINEHGSLSIGLISTLHWSRQYELAWAIDVAELQKNHVVLDAGCGYSTTKYALAKRCEKVVGIDLNLEYLAKARKGCEKLGFKNIELQYSDIANYETDLRFDRILCLSVLEHDFSESNKYKCIDNMIRLLKPGGLLILSYDIINVIREDVDFSIDQTISDKILGKLGQKRLVYQEAPFSGTVGDNILVTVCCAYQKPY